jgi:hypothetical protein
MTLEPQQKALLKELSLNPVWISLLASIRESLSAAPRWKRSGEDGRTEEEKRAEWIHHSGKLDELDNILLILGGTSGR